MIARPARRLVRPALLAAAALALVACGDGARHPPAHVRLVLEGAGGEPVPTAPTVAESFALAEDALAWEVEAPFQRLVRRPEAETDGGPTHELVLKATEKGETMLLRRTGTLDPALFNRIHLPCRFDGQGYVRADLLRDGRVVGRTEPVRIVPTDDRISAGLGALTTELVLPPALRFEAPVDALELHVTGVYRFLSLAHVLLVKVPPEAMLPPPGTPGELVRVGLEARRAVGLLTGRPLSTEVRVPPGAELRVAYGQPVAELRPDGPTLVECLLDGAVVDSVPLPHEPQPDGGWMARRIDVSAAWGRRATIGFRIVAEGARATLGCAVAEPVLVAPDPEAPTVLLVTTDTHRADHMGFARDGVDVETPAADALAARGLVFDDCWAPVNVTNPSHAALMTARSVRVTGVRSNYSRLSDAAPTLAEAFADAGWATMAAVSTRHLGADGSGLGQGFDRMSWPRGQPRRRAVETIADVDRWLPDADGRPLFLWVHVFDAHWPYEPEPEWTERYWPPERGDPRDPSLPDPGIDPAALKPEFHGVRDMDWPRSLYRAEISGQDALLRGLLERPRVRSGVVALVADHGESLGGHDVWFDHVGLYPDVLHIPLVLAGPGVPVGERTDRPVVHTDVARTLLDLAGLEDVPFPGADLLDARPAEPRFAIEGYGFAASVTHGGMHLVLHLVERERALHEVELYDIRKDPGCLHDLVDERPEEARRMRARLVEWLSEVPDRDWGEERQDDQAFLDALAQLGYVEPEAEVSADLWVPDDCARCRRFDD